MEGRGREEEEDEAVVLGLVRELLAVAVVEAPDGRGGLNGLLDFVFEEAAVRSGGIVFECSARFVVAEKEGACSGL